MLYVWVPVLVVVVLLGLAWGRVNYLRGKIHAYLQVTEDMREGKPWQLVFRSPVLREGMREAVRIADERDPLPERRYKSLLVRGRALAHDDLDRDA